MTNSPDRCSADILGARMRDRITKTANGFERDDGAALYVYDDKGKYLGQFQPDMLSEDAGADELWFKTFPGDRCYHELTQAEMEGAAS